MYIDKLLIGLGSFYYKYPSDFLIDVMTEQNKTFVDTRKNNKDIGYLPNREKKMNNLYLILKSYYAIKITRQYQCLLASCNTVGILAIRKKIVGSKVNVYTYSTTTFNSL